MNQKGYSWIEAMLTITVLTIIFGTLLPIATQITMNLHKKKLSMYAAESLYHAAIAYTSHGELHGSREFEGVQFEWTVNERTLCVIYAAPKGELSKCIDYKS